MRMKAVQIRSFGGPEQLYIGEYEKPEAAPRQVLVKVKASALNRADTLQRMGKYPPPPGESPVLGLEMAGEVVGVGAGVSRWKVGDMVCSLLGGGGYAEYAVVHEDIAMPIPAGMSVLEAAAVPEVFLTAFQALRWLARLQEGERVLIHAGASGVGTAAIQLVKAMGAIPLVTASAPKHALCRELGAEWAVDYRENDFAAAILDYTQGEGVDVVIDFIGGPYFQQNLDVLAMEGRLVMLAFLGGVKTEALNLGPVLRKRLTVMGSTLRARSKAYKARLSNDFMLYALPLFESGRLRPVIDSVYDWTEAAEAHRYMEANKNQGKIVLRVS